MGYTISKQFEFSASHVLRGLRPGHQCGRPHGHNYVVKVELTGPLDRNGFVVDYGDLAPFKKWIDEKLDHRNLNEVAELGEANPTAENLSRLLTAALTQAVDLPNSVVPRVWVSETPKTWAVWTP